MSQNIRNFAKNFAKVGTTFATEIKDSLMITARTDKLPSGIQDFEGLINDGYRYVDKTEHIYNLMNSGKYFFLSRPRRFGKSLFLSTLKAFFLGKRELFEGLAIARHEDITWEKHPVLYVDLNVENYKKLDVLTSRLNLFLCNWEKIYEKDENEVTLGARFEGVIRRAYEQTGLKAVILVDEYDKPLLEAIGNTELQEDFRDTLRGFYSALKSMDACIEFAMLTGGHQVRQTERIQRAEQSDGHIDGQKVCRHLRHHRKRDARQLRNKHQDNGCGERNEL